MPMNILMVNKFLYPRGGAESYALRLGAALRRRGENVEFFGVEGPNTVGNSAGAFAPIVDTGSRGKGSAAALYSRAARRKMREAMKKFCPDVVHFNNISYHLTPSVILEAAEQGAATVLTAHDYQLVCPNYRLLKSGGELCEGCIGRGCLPCLKRRCVHGSLAKSALAAAENALWRTAKAYSMLGAVICPSRFLAEKLSARGDIRDKLTVLPSFAEGGPLPTEGGKYVLYFGRLVEEKGLNTLLAVSRSLKSVPFVIAGDGPLRAAAEAAGENVRCTGFLPDGELKRLIVGARFTVHPSEWYENCSLSVLESLALGVPAVGADIGGIPETIVHGRNGLLFKSGNAASLKAAVTALWSDEALLGRLREGCRGSVTTEDDYCEKILKLYNSLVRR